MLVSFAATNCRSIRQRVELSLVAESRPVTTDRARLLVPGFGLELVPALAIVGANGAGKSNVLRAIEYVTSAVLSSQRSWPADGGPPRSPFEGVDGPMLEPSVFEVVFTAGDEVYEYEFHVGAEAIEYERLAVAANGPRSWTRLFERSTSPSGAVAVRAGRRLRGARSAAVDATRANSLFLSSAAQNNHRQLQLPWRALVESIRSASGANFSERRHRSVYTADALLTADDAFRERLRQFIASADLGIDDVIVREHEVDSEETKALFAAIATIDPSFRPPSDGNLILSQTTFAHRGDVGALELEQESSGTLAWYEWAAPVLETIDRGIVLGADEIDAHLNSHLVAQIVRLFQQPTTNRRGAQLVFSVQDPAVLSLAGLARDQVWVVEKQADGGTALSPVTDYSPRRDWDIGQAYRHGRFGGLPVVDEDALAGAVIAFSDDA